MPTLEQYLWDIHSEMRSRKLPEMDDDTLRELAKHLQHPDVMQGFQRGQLTAKGIVDEVQTALRSVSGKQEMVSEEASPRNLLLQPSRTPPSFGAPQMPGQLQGNNFANMYPTMDSRVPEDEAALRQRRSLVRGPI